MVSREINTTIGLYQFFVLCLFLLKLLSALLLLSLLLTVDAVCYRAFERLHQAHCLNAWYLPLKTALTDDQEDRLVQLLGKQFFGLFLLL